MKKMISSLIAIAMCVVFSVTACAQENSESSSTYITDSGIKADKQIVPDKIEDLPKSMQAVLSSVDCTLVSYSEVFIDMETGAESRSVMPESDFKMTVGVARLSEEEMKQDKVHGDAFMFMAAGHWITNPIYEMTDCIALSWSDEFTLYYDEGYAYTENYNGAPYFDSSVMTLNSVSAEAGFAYDVNLKLFERQDEIIIIGKVYKDDSTGTANVCASYGHVIFLPSSVDVSFSGGKDSTLSMGVSIVSKIQMASPAYKSFDY